MSAKAPNDRRPCPTLCGRTAKEGHAMCYHCWSKVPHGRQQAVYRTWAAWSKDLADPIAMRAYRDALDAAVDAI